MSIIDRIESLDEKDLSNWLSRVGVQEPIIRKLYDEGTNGRKFVAMIDENPTRFGVSKEEILNISKVKESPESISKLQCGTDNVDVFGDYDCKTIAESTMETALKGIGLAKSGFTYTHVRETAKRIKEDDVYSSLSVNEVMAILTYTYDSGRGYPESNPYFIVNKRLREVDVRVPCNCDMYILYLLAALRRLNRYPMNGGSTLYRCVCSEKEIPGYDNNSIVEWKGFSSTSNKSATANGFLVHGYNYKYMFEISGNAVGYAISEYSYLSNEGGIYNCISFYFFIY